MGSEGKSRKRQFSPSPTPVSSQDEDERSKKHRKRDDKERKMDKKKGEKSHKHSRSRDGKEKSKGKHKHSRKNLDSLEIKEISKDDYFSKNNEFSTWLKEEKGIYFSDLSSEAARDLFSSFVKDWNSHKLWPQYYEGIASAPRTTHNWKIKHEK